MNYDGQADEKETIDPANLALTGAVAQRGAEDAAANERQKFAANQEQVVQGTEDDLEMTDTSS